MASPFPITDEQKAKLAALGYLPAEEAKAPAPVTVNVNASPVNASNEPSTPASKVDAGLPNAPAPSKSLVGIGGEANAAPTAKASAPQYGPTTNPGSWTPLTAPGSAPPPQAPAPTAAAPGGAQVKEAPIDLSGPGNKSARLTLAHKMVNDGTIKTQGEYNAFINDDASANAASPSMQAPKPKSPFIGSGVGIASAPKDPYEQFYSPKMKEYIAGLNASQDKKMQGTQAEADAMSEGENHKAVLMRNTAEELENMQAANDAKEETRKKVLDDHMAKLQTDTEDLKNTKIDPDRWWSSRTTGQSFQAGLALVLGAMGGAARGENGGADVIMKKIGADIDAQKANAGYKKDALELSRGFFQDRMKQFGDERLADKAARIDYLDSIQMQVQGMVANTNDKMYQANGQKLIAGLEQEKGKMNMSFQQAAEDDAKRRAAAAAQAAYAQQQKSLQFQALVANGASPQEAAALVNGGAAGEFVKTKKTHENTMELEASKESAKTKPGEISANVIVGYDGSGQPIKEYRAFGSKDDATEMKKFTSTYEAARAKIERLQELRSKHNGGQILNGEDTAEAKSLAASLKFDMNHMAGISRMSEKDVELLDRSIPDNPLEVKASGLIGSDPVGTMLKTAKSNMDQMNKSHLDAHSTEEAAAKTAKTQIQGMKPVQ